MACEHSKAKASKTLHLGPALENNASRQIIHEKFTAHLQDKSGFLYVDKITLILAPAGMAIHEFVLEAHTDTFRDVANEISN